LPLIGHGCSLTTHRWHDSSRDHRGRVVWPVRDELHV